MTDARVCARSGCGEDVVHRNLCGVDNRRTNLRLCTRSQNLCNRRCSSYSRKGLFKGVRKRGGRWQANIAIAEQHYYLGSYETLTEAAYAYDAAAQLHHGEFARLNFPDEAAI